MTYIYIYTYIYIVLYMYMPVYVWKNGNLLSILVEVSPPITSFLKLRDSVGKKMSGDSGHTIRTNGNSRWSQNGRAWHALSGWRDRDA